MCVSKYMRVYVCKSAALGMNDSGCVVAAGFIWIEGDAADPLFPWTVHWSLEEILAHQDDVERNSLPDSVVSFKNSHKLSY